MDSSYSSYRNILSIAFPILLGSIGQNLVQAVDTAFLGRLGEVELGAAAVGGVFYFVLYLTGHGFNTGMQIIVARRYGEGQFRRIGEVVDHQLVMVFFLALLLFVNYDWWTPELFTHLVQSEKVRRQVQVFLDVRMLGIFWALMNSALMGFYLGINNTRVVLWSSVAMTVVNVVLDYGLIFGHWGMPRLGMAGAAYASVASEITVTLVLIGYLLMRRWHWTFSLFCLRKPQWPLMQHIVWISAPLVVQNLISIGAWFLFFILIEAHLGEQALAISSLNRSLYAMLSLPLWALGSTTSAMVSTLIGRQQADGVFSLLIKICRLSFFYAALVASVTYLWPGALVSLYINDPALLHASLPTVHILPWIILVASVSLLFLFGVSGTGATRMALTIEIVCIVVYIGYLWLVVIHKPQPLPTVWVAEIVYWALALFFCAVYLRTGHWKKKVI